MISETVQCWLHPGAKLRDLIDDSTSTHVQASDLLNCTETRVLRIKKALQLSRVSKRGQMRCGLCGTAVYLSGLATSRLYVFKHFQEDGSCPHETRGGLTAKQILAYRYQAQRESRRHIQLKNLVADCIRCDQQFTEPEIEGTWKGKGGKRRRPDVSSYFKDQIQIAFEVQLSTTFDSVIAYREEFYRDEGGLLLWVFASFKGEEDRLMNRFVFANNNRNAFVVNDHTLVASRENGKLVLECFWRQPSLGKNGIVWTICRKFVQFDELTLDPIGQRAFYVDTDALEEDIARKLEGASFSERMEEFWLTLEAFDGRPRLEPGPRNKEWNELHRLAKDKGVMLPVFHDKYFDALMRSIYSFKHGKAVGWDYTELWGVAMHIFAQFPKNFPMLVCAIDHYGHLQSMENFGKKGTWATKVKTWNESLSKGRQDFQPKPELERAVALSFPELGWPWSADPEGSIPLDEVPF